MIKIEKGTVEVLGSLPMVMADFSTVVHHLYHNILGDHMGMKPEKAKEFILEAVEDGFMQKEELHAKAQEALARHPELLLDALKIFMSRKDDE